MPVLILAACCLIGGSVHTAAGAPIVNAQVVVHTAAVKQVATAADGSFRLDAPPGTYRISVSARGFTSATASVPVDHDVKVDFALQPSDAPSFRTIATVSVDGRLTPIEGTIPSVSFTRAQFDRMGYDLVGEGVKSIPSVTFARPDGGGSTAISVIALRGPDPSETLVGLDGQLLNDANTGDLDISRLSVSAFDAVDVTEGLGTRDSEGSNTIGGAVNFLSLHPTKDAHTAFSFSGGTFGRTEGWLNTTGTRGRLGYALAVDDQQQGGYVNDDVLVYQPGLAPNCDPLSPVPLNCGQLTHLGSTASARSLLTNLTWNFSQNADLSFRFFTVADQRDQSSSVNGIDGHEGSATEGLFIGPGTQTFAQNIRAYQMRGRTALGAGELVATLSTSNNSANIDGGVSNPMYDVTHRDTRSTGSLSWQRTFENSEYEIGGYSRHETFSFLDPSGEFPGLGQTISSYYARGSFDASAKLHLSGGAYFSHYTTFGANVDGRLGLVYDADPSTSFRASWGTGFRAPLLIERYVFPDDQLPAPDANCVIGGQGNPDEVPEHATEYEVGVSHRFASQATLDVSLYRTNLRDVIENFYPLNTVNPGCATTYTSFPINVGNAVYEGAEMRYVQRIDQHLFVTAAYGLNVAFPRNLGDTVSNPTSGGVLVNGQQFADIPQQQGSLGLDWMRGGWHASGLATFRGNNNELHQRPFTFVDAAVGKQLSHGLDLTLAGTNLFDGASGRYTLFGAGQPYRGLTTDSGGSTIVGNLPTDLLRVEPVGFRFILTIRH